MFNGHMQERHVAAARNLDPAELNRLAARATTHCLTGCATGEIVGLVIADIVGLAVAPPIALAVVLAFAFGFGLTLRPLLAGGLAVAAAARLAVAADTLTITVMEIVNNAIVLLVPGAMEAGLGNPPFWAASRSRSRWPGSRRSRSPAGSSPADRATP